MYNNSSVPEIEIIMENEKNHISPEKQQQPQQTNLLNRNSEIFNNENNSAFNNEDIHPFNNKDQLENNFQPKSIKKQQISQQMINEALHQQKNQPPQDFDEISIESQHSQHQRPDYDQEEEENEDNDSANKNNDKMDNESEKKEQQQLMSELSLHEQSEKEFNEESKQPEPLITHKKKQSQKAESQQQQKQQSSINNNNQTKKGNVRSSKFQVYEDCTCMLNLTDIAYGVKGHNKFYQIVLLHRDQSEFRLFTKWGRVGAQNPQSNSEDFSSLTLALQSFKKKFYDKTHNDWDARKKFEPKPGKYTYIKVDLQSKSNNSNSINDEIDRLNKRNELLRVRILDCQSALPPKVKSLMEMIWDLKRLNKTLKELNFDTEKNPLGRLQIEQIAKGYKILSELQNALTTGARQSTIIELSNQFYTNIPQNYGMHKLPMIDHVSKVKEKVHLLDVLKEIDVINKYIQIIIDDTQHKEQNPLDTFFEMLRIKIKYIQPQEEIAQKLSKIFENCHGPTHNKYKLQIQDIYEIERQGESQRFYPFQQLNNRTLLWHGSRVSNFIGIISEGLRIAPPDAPASGYMFGKGIYFSDIPSKAANYCHPKEDNPEGLILLCEVALGSMYQVFKAKGFKKPPKYYHSVQGVGRNRPDPQDKIQIYPQVQINAGKVIENPELSQNNVQSDLIYNEFIVYDVAQVQIKYILRIKFNYLQM